VIRAYSVGAEVPVLTSTSIEGRQIAVACASAIGEIDPNLALFEVQSLEDILDRAAAQLAFTMILIIIAASVALMLGVIGIYGVMSYIVSQRTGEIGVRLALGADPGHVAGMIIRQGGLVAIAGIIVGLGLATPAANSLRRCSTGVSARDPTVFAATTVLLLTVRAGPDSSDMRPKSKTPRHTSGHLHVMLQTFGLECPSASYHGTTQRGWSYD
jgi:ABC-type antimicrobial peptide transport system permease subunit